MFQLASVVETCECAVNAKGSLEGTDNKRFKGV